MTTKSIEGRSPMRRGATLESTIAHHDAAISSLSGRMHGVETELKSMHGQMHTGFENVSQALAAMSSKLDKQEARPVFNFHQAVGTVLALAVLFSMVVGGIIWVTTSQFSGVLAEQKALNTALTSKTERNEALIEKLAERVGWVARLEGKK
jgi:uncharacterized coiled-coil protein SlyX